MTEPKAKDDTFQWILILICAVVYLVSAPLSMAGIMASAMLNDAGRAQLLGQSLQMASVGLFIGYPVVSLVSVGFTIYKFKQTQENKWLQLLLLPLLTLLGAVVCVLLFFAVRG